jgi:hypothetical protein
LAGCDSRFGATRGALSACGCLRCGSATDQWTALRPATEAGGRKFPAVAYDPVGDRLLSFGGQLTDNSRGGDLWALDLESDTWSVVSTSGPAPRDGAILVYIASQVRLILFGGTTPDGNGGDTWSMTLESPTTAVASETTLPVSSSLAVLQSPHSRQVQRLALLR